MKSILTALRRGALIPITVLAFTATSLQLHGGQNAWIGSQAGFWDNPANWSQGLPGPNDDVTLPPGTTVTHRFNNSTIRSLSSAGTLELIGGTLLITTPSTISGGLNLGNGSLVNADDLHITGPFHWSGGSLSGSGVFFVDGEAMFDGPNTKYFSSKRVVLSGNAVWGGSGWLLGSDGAIFDNKGVMECQSDASYAWDFAGAPPTFLNRGIFKKTQTAGESVFGNTVVDQRGVFEIQSGSIRLESVVATNTAPVFIGSNSILRIRNSRLTLAGPAQGAGMLVLESGLLIPTDSSINNFSQRGGTVTGPGRLTLLDTFDWSGGSQEGAGRTLLSEDCSTRLHSQNTKFLSHRTLENHGLLRSEDVGTFLLQQSLLDNAGLFEARSDSAVSWSFNETAPTFINRGTFRKLGASGESTFNNLVLDQRGTFEILSGSLRFEGLAATNTASISLGTNTTLRIRNGSFTVASPIQGPGTLVLESGSLIPRDTSIQNLSQTGGSIVGQGTLTLLSSFDWSGGLQEGLGRTILADGSSTLLRSSNTKFLSHRTLENHGRIRFQDPGPFLLQQAVVDNAGLFEARNDAPIAWDFNELPPTFLNRGTYRKLEASGESALSNLVLDQRGAFEILSGSVRFEALAATNTSPFSLATNTTLRIRNGSLTLASPVQGSGALVLESGTLNPRDASIDHFTQLGGTVVGNATLTLVRSFEWQAGAQQDAGQTLIARTCLASLTGGGTKQLSNRGFVNQGILEWNGPGVCYAENSTLLNEGLMDLQSAATAASELLPPCSRTRSGVLSLPVGAFEGADVGIPRFRSQIPVAALTVRTKFERHHRQSLCSTVTAVLIELAMKHRSCAR